MQKKILIVDDQTEIQRLLEVTLRQEDYSLFLATAGLEALEMAESERPDLVILDIMLPGEIDGYEVARRLKAKPGTAHVKILMLTALAREENRRTGLTAGADDYMTKPFSPVELLSKVQHLLDDD